MTKEELIRYLEQHQQEITEINFIAEFLNLALYGDESNNPTINELHTILKEVPDETKKDIITNISNNYIKYLIAATYNNKEYKIDFLENIANCYDKETNQFDEILKELHCILIEKFPESIQIKIINKFEEIYQRIDIMKQLRLEIPSELLNSADPQKDQEKLDKITNLQDVEEILKLIYKLIREDSKLIAINRLVSLGASNEIIYRAAYTLVTDEAILKVIELSPDTYGCRLSTKLKQDKSKFAVFNLIKDEMDKFFIANQLTQDEFIFEAIKTLSTINIEGCFVELIKCLSNDSLKLKTLEILPISYIYSVADCLEDDENKIQLMNKYKDIRNRLNFIHNLSLDRNKITYIKEIICEKSYIKNNDINRRLLSIILFNFKNRQNLYKFKDIINHLFKELPDNYKERIIEDINHHPEHKEICYEILFDELLQYSLKTMPIEKEKFCHVANLFGNEIFEYRNNVRFIRLLENLSIDDFTKLHELLHTEDLSMTDVYGIFNSFIQQKINEEFKEPRGMYQNLLKEIEENNFDNVLSILNFLTNQNNILKIFNNEELQTKIKKQFSSSFAIPKTRMEITNFLSALTIKIFQEKDVTEKTALIDILHEITELNVNILRDEYVKNSIENIHKHTNLQMKYDKDTIIKRFLSPNTDTLSIINILTNTYVETLDIETQELLNNPQIIAECIKFKRDPKNYQETSIPKHLLLKKYLKQFNKILNLTYDQGLLSGFATFNDKIEYSVNNNINYYNLLIELNHEYLTQELLANKELFNNLKLIMNKFKLAKWSDTFSPILESLDLEMTEENIINFINSFSKITFNQEITSLKPIDLVGLVNNYAPTNEQHKTIFGPKNYSYLVRNSTPNSAALDKKSRLTKSLDAYQRMYARSKITIPPFDTIVPIGNEKNIRIIVGDVINPINLTLGERTGSCMRIGGVADSLFDFCNTNPNGFHIRFEDPDTGELISRVSGFRNGNTVFLNQLRNSIIPKYNNPEVIKACKLAAKQIIELANENNDLIDNVVISDGVAMGESGMSKTELGIIDNKEGYGYFYSDINNQAIILKTTNNDNLVKVDLTSNKKEYDIIRSKPIICHNQEMAEQQVNRLLMIETLLTTKNPENSVLVSEVTTAIVGEDWFLYTTKDGEIVSKIISGINEERKKLADKEIIEYLSNYHKYFETPYISRQSKSK